jgi:hypothetical protein
MSGALRGVCSQQNIKLNFNTTGKWCPNIYTDVITNSDGSSIEILSNNVYTSYDSWRQRGFAPMFIMEIAKSLDRVCLSANLSANVNTNSLSKCFGGVMLLDGEYKPLFECGIGTWADQPFPYEDDSLPEDVYTGPPQSNCASTIPSTTSPSICEKRDVSIDTKLTTFFRPHFGIENNYTHSQVNVNYNERLPITFEYIRATKQLGFICGKNGPATVCTLLAPAVYVSFFMRGYGKNSVKIENLKYYGVRDHALTDPTVSISDYAVVQNAKTYGNDITKSSTTLDTCMKMCKTVNECEYFEYDNLNSECSLKKSFKNEEIYSKDYVVKNASPVPPAVKVNTNMYMENSKFPLVSGFYIFYDTTTNQYSKLNVGNVNITMLCMDNSYESYDFVTRDDTGKVYIGGFGITLATHPVTRKGTLALEFKLQNSNKFYLVSEKDTNFRSNVYILDSNRNVYPNIRVDNLTYGLYRTLLSGIFEHSYIHPVNQDQIVKMSSNSFAIINRMVSFYNVNGTPTVTNLVPRIISPCKIIVSENPLTALMPISSYEVVLVTNTSVWPSQITKGDMFSSLLDPSSPGLTDTSRFTGSYFPSTFVNDINFFWEIDSDRIYLSKAGGQYYYVYFYDIDPSTGIMSKSTRVGTLTNTGLTFTKNNVSYKLYSNPNNTFNESLFYRSDGSYDLNYLNTNIDFFLSNQTANTTRRVLTLYFEG